MKLRNILIPTLPFVVAALLICNFLTPSVSAYIEQPVPFSVSFINKQDLFDEVNKIREFNGLNKLTINANLNNTALSKCKDLVERDYWSHIDPDGNKSLVLQDIKNPNGQYYKSGENLANGYTNANDVVSGWMNSELHRKNILDKDYTLVGYAVCYSPDFVHAGKKLLVVQHFARFK